MVFKLLNICPRRIHIGFSHMNASDTEYLIVCCMCEQANVANILIWFTRYCPEFTCEKGCEDWNQGDTASKHRKIYQPAGQYQAQLYGVASARGLVPPTSRLDVFQKRQLRVLHVPILLTPDCQIWLFWSLFFLVFVCFHDLKSAQGVLFWERTRCTVLCCSMPLPSKID